MLTPKWHWLSGLVAVIVVALVGVVASNAWQQKATPAFEAQLRALSTPATSRQVSIPVPAGGNSGVASAPRTADDAADNEHPYTQPNMVHAVPDTPFAPDSERWEDIATLSVSGGRLSLDGNARAIAESLQQGLSQEQLARSLPVIEAALAQRLGAIPAREFVTLVENYGDYIDEMRARHAGQVDGNNARAWVGSGDAGRQLAQLQNEVFGAEAAAALFRTDRQLLAVMERHMARYGGNIAALTQEDIERMQQDYAALYANTSP